MKILLLEDNEMNSKIFLRIFSQNGYTDVIHCVTGSEAAKVARTQPIDIMFVDFDLPDVNGMDIGLALAREIKNNILPPFILVALTAQSDKATQNEAQKLGFDAFLSKPITPDDLVSLLDHFKTKIEKEPVAQ